MLLDFIVLGQIPGTNIQISFYLYVIGIQVLAIALLTTYLIRYELHQIAVRPFLNRLVDFKKIFKSSLEKTNKDIELTRVSL